MSEPSDSHIREVMGLEFKLRDKALELQATEIERRLTALNGEADRLRRMQAEYVPRETYYSERNKTAADIDDLKAFKNNMLGRQTIIAGVTAAIVSLAIWLLTTLTTHNVKP